jgi:adenylate kinase
MKLGKEHDELRTKIMAGIQKAYQELLIKTAREDGKVVIADENGEIKHVPAKELLKAGK